VLECECGNVIFGVCDDGETPNYDSFECKECLGIFCLDCESEHESDLCPGCAVQYYDEYLDDEEEEDYK